MIRKRGLSNSGFKVQSEPTNIGDHLAMRENFNSNSQPPENKLAIRVTVNAPVLNEERKQYAVCVRNAYKNYGTKKKPNYILNNLNMTVDPGTIYGLLGASGCGKTTLLSCIVGRKRLNNGDVWVLGGEPGTKGSGVPGKRVGYMPQEIALYGEFTIRETLRYFGWIYGMKTQEIDDRCRFLLSFLDLPGPHRRVKNLSGGQQRRVSFAVALIHDPQLLILDEPTVGVDPLLRQSIWNHLVNITKDGDKTCIITTHYIDEAKQAHTIGLLRNGKLLAEEAPDRLLAMYNCVTLEEVFLKLSKKQGTMWSTAVPSPALPPYKSSFSSLNEKAIDPTRPPKRKEIKTCDYCSCSDVSLRKKLRALLMKDFLRMWRNIGIMCFILFLPILQVAIFCLSIGRDPRGLPLGVVNEEVVFTSQTSTKCTFDSTGCPSEHMSCRYLSYLENNNPHIHYYKDLNTAMEAVKRGNSWGVLYFPKNYTESLLRRIDMNEDNMNEDILMSSEIRTWLDMSNHNIGNIMQRDIQTAFQKFYRGILKSCKNNPDAGNAPVNFKSPIYGEIVPSFTDFLAAGVILSIVFFLALALTSSSLIVERTEGLFDRTWIAGVRAGEILLSHVITQFLVMCAQSVLVIIFMMWVFGIRCHGDIFWAIVLTILQGLCGMAFGFLISSICELERTAIQLATGSFYPMLLLSGILWPIEGMPKTLMIISKFMPITMATTALRSIFTRGWGITKFEVYIGFISSLVWIVIFIGLSLAVFRGKRG